MKNDRNNKIYNKKYFLFMSSGIFVLFGTLFTLLCIRYRLSVDLTDESYYLSSIYGYLRGNVPISTIWDGHPGFVLFAPILLVFKLVSGSYDGSMMFIRYSYLVFCLLSMVLVFLAIKKETGKMYGILMLIPIVFITPFSIANFSYNTVGNILVILSSYLMFSVRLYDNKKKNVLLISTGIISAIMAFNYPTLIILCLINSFLLYFVRRIYDNKINSIKDVLRYILAGIATAITIFIGILTKSDLSSFINGISGIMTSPYKNTHKNIDLVYIYNVFVLPFKDYFFSKFFIINLFSLFCTFILLSLFNKLKKQKRFCFITFGLTTFLFVNLYYRADLSIYSIYLYLFFHIIIFIYFITDKKLKKLILINLLFPPVLCVVIYSFSSNNNNVMYGMFFASSMIITFLYCIYILSKQYLDNKTIYKIENLGSFIVLSAAISIIFLSNYYNYVYRDSSFNQLNYKIESGIYKGLYTTEQRKKGLEELNETINKHTNNNKTVVVASNFAGAYIMSGLEPMTPTIFEPLLMEYGFTSAQPLIDYYNTRKSIPDTLIVIFYEKAINFYEDDKYEINEFINKNYKINYKDEKAYYPIYIYDRRKD